MILAVVSILIKLYYFLNVFQKSFYEYRYFKNIKICKLILFCFSGILSIILFFFDFFILKIFLLFCLTNELILISKTVKVYLKFTKRIIRLIITNLFLVVLLHFMIDLSFIVLFIPILIIVSDLINTPIELVIKNKFIKKAKRKVNKLKCIKIAVTGSYGKTSTKHYLSNILRNKYIVKSSQKSYNTPLGLSKFINEENFNCVDFIVYEFGARRKGDIYELAKIFSYDIAIVTEIGYMHVDTFKNIETIVDEKMSICNYLSESGVAILNYENEFIRNYHVSNKKITYGFNHGDYQAKNILLSIFGSSFDLYKNDEFVKKFYIKPLGKGAIINFLPAIILADMFKVDYRYIEKISSVENRLSLRIIDNYYILDDAYNSNLVGATYALEVLNSHNGKKYLITPGFVESDMIKEELAIRYAEVINLNCDMVYLVKNKFTLCLSEFIKIEYKFVENFEKGFKLFLMDKDDNSILLIENDLYE